MHEYWPRAIISFSCACAPAPQEQAGTAFLHYSACDDVSFMMWRLQVRLPYAASGKRLVVHGGLCFSRFPVGWTGSSASNNLAYWKMIPRHRIKSSGGIAEKMLQCENHAGIPLRNDGVHWWCTEWPSKGRICFHSNIITDSLESGSIYRPPPCMSSWQFK